MTANLDELIRGVAERVGVERACRALGTHPRSYRHRLQARRGRARPRGRAARARAAEPVTPGDALLATSETPSTTTEATTTTTEPISATTEATATKATTTETTATATTTGTLASDDLGADAVAVSDVQRVSAAADHAGPASVAAAIAATAAARS